MDFKRHDDRVVLVVTEAGLAFSGQHTDDGAGDVADADRLSHRVFCPKEFLTHRFADDAADLTAAIFGGLEVAAERNGPVLRDQIIVGGADDTCLVVLAAENDGCGGTAVLRRNGTDA
ncbi:hypothetical protein D3C78_1245940 [compost metagenome]